MALQETLLRRISDLESLLVQNIESTSMSITHNRGIRSPVSQHDSPLIQDELDANPASISTDGQSFVRYTAPSQRDKVGSIITSQSGHVRYVPYSTSRDPDVFHSLQNQSQVECPSRAFFFCDTPPSKQSLLDMLPPFRHCDELITMFLTVFSPLFHILHDETFQSNYARFKENPRNAPLPVIGLIFVALGLAVTAIDKESPILSDLGREASPAESAKSLAAKYRQATIKCLAADNFMWQHNLQTLQCLILLIYAINHAQGPAWALLGTTLNIAIAIGCHVDPELLSLNPIEVQERRRAWAGLKMLYTIQNTCLGNLAPFNVENNVLLPADVEDEEIAADSLHEDLNSSRSKRPTKMSYLLFKFRLYSLASSVCALSAGKPSCSPAKIHALDHEIEIELQAQADRFSDQVDLPTYQQAHSFILSNYTNHLILLLHRICLLSPEVCQDGSLTGSYEKCEQAALAILSNYETLNMRNEFSPYRWYIHGLGSFHAFLAISTLLVLLGKERTAQNSKNIILQAVQNCFQQLHKNAPYSEICERACSILDSLTPGEPHQPTPFLGLSDSVSNWESTPDFGSNEPLGVDTATSSNSFDRFDPSFWALPESFEEIVAKIPCEQWLSPAAFPWTGRPVDTTYDNGIV
ncbi:hypothetical protein AbraIFM66951_004625 [Aspergillus brasiliensis]|uniref:Xylanolytic transcriptional activator regulatory domain-containing protein n=1 Tax=Aspergillus brasiliensis TaxID=319629 RepID=A0A9W5YWH1_9EURO|nr:hypothetical protein AbraCBS73388_010374 [Aspergillus brasiliensis]GKZ50928.1 hypothetical protein AbraIFM66951_004625 [Aspergillus brasiliensis]